VEEVLDLHWLYCSLSPYACQPDLGSE
jgi:hypothetical protein